MEALKSSPDRSSGNELGVLPILPAVQNLLPQFSTNNRIPSASQNHKASHKVPVVSAALTVCGLRRKRVPHACRECRRMKVKCTGARPCHSCTSHDYDCVFDGPGRKRPAQHSRSHQPAREKAGDNRDSVEKRLRKVKSLLSRAFPAVHLEDHMLDTSEPQELYAKLTLSGNGSGYRVSASSKATGTSPLFSESPDPDDADFESMVESSSLLGGDDQAQLDFHGQGSGSWFLRSLKGCFQREVFDSRKIPIPDVQDIEQLLEDQTKAANFSLTDLPSKEQTLCLCQTAFRELYSSTRFLHEPTFYALVDRIYTFSPVNWDHEQQRALRLLYAVLAIGILLEGRDKMRNKQRTNDENLKQGYLFFNKAIQSFNVATCRDLSCLQTLCCLIIFLQSAAQLDRAYSYLGVAIRYALRLGLHKPSRAASNPVEQEMRKRTFWAIRQIDAYLSSFMGMPQMLREDDIDQDQPLEIDDDLIRVEGMSPMPPGRTSYMTYVNAHNRLVKILPKIIQLLYLVKGWDETSSRRVFRISYSKVREIECQLQSWTEEIRFIDQRTNHYTPEIAMIRHALHLSFGYIQMVLYRPFIHYLSDLGRSLEISREEKRLAYTCVQVSRQIILKVAPMARQGLHIGPDWRMMYSTLFAVLNLLYCVRAAPPESRQSVYNDAVVGKEALATFAAKSSAALPCMQGLTEIFKDSLKFIPSYQPHKSCDYESQLEKEAVAKNGGGHVAEQSERRNNQPIKQER